MQPGGNNRSAATRTTPGQACSMGEDAALKGGATPTQKKTGTAHRAPTRSSEDGDVKSPLQENQRGRTAPPQGRTQVETCDTRKAATLKCGATKFCQRRGQESG